MPKNAASKETVKLPREKPSRYRKARIDGSIGTLQDTIEQKFGLPSGSVKMVRKTGRKVRSDATVGSLIRHWQE